LEPDIIRDKPIISNKSPIHQDNSLPPISAKLKSAKTNFQLKPPTSEISPKTSDKFLLNTGKQLPLITDREQPTEKEQILLDKIKYLEEQMKQVQTENNNLKLENQHLKSLIKQDQETEAKILQPPPFKPNK
jgi:hypothetical protein